MYSNCAGNYVRMHVGHLILDELKKDGIKETEYVIEVINSVLDKSNLNAVIRGIRLVAKVPDLPELCKIYAEVKTKINEHRRLNG
jgi:hypothetical protein